MIQICTNNKANLIKLKKNRKSFCDIIYIFFCGNSKIIIKLIKAETIYNGEASYRIINGYHCYYNIHKR